MPTKEMLLELLQKCPGRYFSGEEVASALSVSRAAVWKAVKRLRSEGYPIEGVTHKGYCLSEAADILSADAVKDGLPAELKGLALEALDSAASTNSYLKELAENGASDGRMVIALEQTGGKGRFGRSFFSPVNSGLYFSLLLRPKKLTADLSNRITTIAAVAVCEAAEKISGKAASIKWVNDVYIEGKKVCGILTEGAFDMETGCLNYAVLGAGVNLYPPKDGFPQDIAETAGAILDSTVSNAKNIFIINFLTSFYRLYNKKGDHAEQYRRRCFVIGKKVTLAAGNTSREALVLDIDSQCRLKVRFDDGSEKTFSSGEISLKL